MGKPDFAAVSRTHDMHRLALLIRLYASSIFFYKKASYYIQCCPAKALTWMTQIRTRIRICQRIMKTIAKVSNGAKIRNRYNQVPHLTQDTNGKVTNSQKTPQTRA